MSDLPPHQKQYRVWLRQPGMTGWGLIAQGLTWEQSKVYQYTLMHDYNIEEEIRNG